MWSLYHPQGRVNFLAWMHRGLPARDTHQVFVSRVWDFVMWAWLTKSSSRSLSSTSNPNFFPEVRLITHDSKAQIFNYMAGRSGIIGPHHKTVGVAGSTLSHVLNINCQVLSMSLFSINSLLGSKGLTIDNKNPPIPRTQRLPSRKGQTSLLAEAKFFITKPYA